MHPHGSVRMAALLTVLHAVGAAKTVPLLLLLLLLPPKLLLPLLLAEMREVQASEMRNGDLLRVGEGEVGSMCECLYARASVSLHAYV